MFIRSACTPLTHTPTQFSCRIEDFSTATESIETYAAYLFLKISVLERDIAGAHDQMSHDVHEDSFPADSENDKVWSPTHILDVACFAGLNVSDEQNAIDDPV